MLAFSLFINLMILVFNFCSALKGSRCSHRSTKDTALPKRSILSRKNTGEISDLKLYNEGTVTKTVWYWHKDKQVDQ